VVINRKGLIDSVNPAAENIFGYSAAEMLGQNVKMLMPPPFEGEHDEYLRRYLETGRAKIIGIGREVIGRRKDGTTFPMDLAVSAMDHLGLFTGILRDITERKRLERHVLEVAADEQRRIGQELHDGTQQELTGISMIAGTILDLLNKASQEVVADKSVWMLDHGAFYRICDMTIKLNQRLSETSRNVHQLSHGIMPVQIDPQGLRAALQELTASTNDLKGISCCLDCRIAGEVTNSSKATHLYRIAQEAVNNALRHSRADQIEISLKQQDHQLSLEVRDNGVGFDPEDLSRNGLPDEKKGMGLQIMAYRAGMIGGTLRVQRGAAGGTCVKCEIFKGVEIRGE
jgi:PAS domain S-box-containing protein